jgi:orotidine-5'-phosphate decarboxylase
MTFVEKLERCVAANNSLLCVGLDPDVDKLPQHLKSDPQPLFTFNKAIIDATAELVCIYKPNSAFYEAHGAEGIEQLKETCEYIQKNHPEIPILLDFKRGDIGNTNKAYAKFAFEYLGVDAVTIQPYLGSEANEAFFEYKDKGIIVLCRTSNPGAAEFQDLESTGKKLYVAVAENVKNKWNKNGNCHIMVGATYPKELAEVRGIIGDGMIILVPGIGAQGGDVEATVKAGVNKEGEGIMISSSREILYASTGEDFAEASRQKAQATRDSINKYR